MLSQEIMSLSNSLANELCWKYHDALVVIEELFNHSQAIVGVEVWKKLENAPLWIASSNYSFDSSNLSWKEYVKQCKQAAFDFVKTFQNHPNALFHFVWIHEK